MSKNSSLWSDAIYRLTRNKAAMMGGGILVALIISALLAPWIAPYSYSYQDLDLGASPPSAEHLGGGATSWPRNSWARQPFFW